MTVNKPNSFKNLYVAVSLVLAIFMIGCYTTTNGTDDKMQNKQETLLTELFNQVGMPNIVNFTEAKLVKYLYELRDQKGLVSYTYVMDLNGNLHHVCDSVGFGIPYGVQFSNPQKNVWTDGADHTHTWVNTNLPQAEPNGLFMPPTADGTWVMCSDPSKKEGIAPMYIEPHVVVSPWKLHSVGEWMEPVNKK